MADKSYDKDIFQKQRRNNTERAIIMMPINEKPMFIGHWPLALVADMTAVAVGRVAVRGYIYNFV